MGRYNSPYSIADEWIKITNHIGSRSLDETKNHARLYLQVPSIPSAHRSSIGKPNQTKPRMHSISSSATHAERAVVHSASVTLVVARLRYRRRQPAPVRDHWTTGLMRRRVHGCLVRSCAAARAHGHCTGDPL